MAHFEVRIVLEAMAAGSRLVLRGKQASAPEFELSDSTGWREEVGKFMARVLGSTPGQIELVDVQCSREGLFPLLVIQARCYLGKAVPPLDDNYRWERESGEAGQDNGTLVHVRGWRFSCRCIGAAECPLPGVKQTEFAAYRPTAYSHKRTLWLVRLMFENRPKQSFEPR